MATETTTVSSSAPPLEVRDSLSGTPLHTRLELPAEAPGSSGRIPRGCVLFVHGSGSNMHSPRNQSLAKELRTVCMATLLVDLLTDAENERDQYTREFRFDIPRLASRVVDCIDALRVHPSTARLQLMLVGSSTGAAGALIAASQRPDAVAAVVSRGGRADLAGEALERVRAPSLLIVGGKDHQVLQLNHEAAARMTKAREVQLKVVPGATHLFEEPGKMEQVATMTAQFLARHADAAAVQAKSLKVGQEEKQSLQQGGDKMAERDEMKQPPEAEAAAAATQKTA